MAPERERLDAVLVFPSMPAVMKLNKLGTFSMEQLGQSKSAIADFMRSSMKKARETNDNYEEGLLKLVRTLPNVRPHPLYLYPLFRLLQVITGSRSEHPNVFWTNAQVSRAPLEILTCDPQHTLYLPLGSLSALPVSSSAGFGLSAEQR